MAAGIERGNPLRDYLKDFGEIGWEAGIRAESFRAQRGTRCPGSDADQPTSERGRVSELAGRQGFEPRYRGPEPRVLPLDDLPTGWAALSEAVKAAPNRRAGNTKYIQPARRAATKPDLACARPQRSPSTCGLSHVFATPTGTSLTSQAASRSAANRRPPRSAPWIRFVLFVLCRGWGPLE